MVDRRSRKIWSMNFLGKKKAFTVDRRLSEILELHLFNRKKLSYHTTHLLLCCVLHFIRIRKCLLACIGASGLSLETGIAAKTWVRGGVAWHISDC